MATRYECRRIGEQLVHVLQIESFGLWQESPEEDAIADVADDEDDVEPPACYAI